MKTDHIKFAQTLVTKPSTYGVHTLPVLGVTTPKGKAKKRRRKILDTASTNQRPNSRGGL